MLKKISILIIFVFLASLCSGCKKKTTVKAPYYPEKISKKSDDLLYFSSSDPTLDFFLNDFFKRHIGYVDENGVDWAVNTLKAGANTDNTFYQEWNTLALYYFDSSTTALDSDRLVGERAYLSTVPVDRYGYVWGAYDNLRGNMAPNNDGHHSMGWPFPTTSTLELGENTSWDFNSNTESWITNNGTERYKSGLLYADANETDSLRFISPALGGLSRIYPYFAPYIELDLRMLVDHPENVEDVYVWFKNSKNDEFTESKRVSLNDSAAIKYEYQSQYEHILYIPMYTNEYWGDYNEPLIAQLMIEIKAKEGTTLSGEFGLNYVRSTLDTRHANNNGIYLSSLVNDYKFTGDISYLVSNMTRARKTLLFYISMLDNERNLVDLSHQVGHDGNRSYVDEKEVDSFDQNIVHSIGNGYWDVLYQGKFDFTTNVYFYKAITSLAYLEGILEKEGIEVDKKEATVLDARREEKALSSIEYTYDSNSLYALAQKVKAALNESVDENNKTGFFDESAKRYIAGFDANGLKIDAGYLMWNLEALDAGIADENREKDIMDWITGRRIVAEDKNGAQGEAIYDLELGPRVTTRNDDTFNPFTSLIMKWDLWNTYYKDYGIKQIQHGGADMYVSYYDLMERIKVYGANDAYSRLTGIKDWYQKVIDYGYSEERFEKYGRIEGTQEFHRYIYVDYYGSLGDEIKLQGGVYGSGFSGGASNGLIGIDCEFIESLILLSAIPYGFFGIDSVDGKTLKVSPKMPDNLDYWKMENLKFSNIIYDLTISNSSVEISAVRGENTDTSIEVSMETNIKNPRVFINGVETTDFTFLNGVVNLTVPFSYQYIEIR